MISFWQSFSRSWRTPSWRRSGGRSRSSSWKSFAPLLKLFNLRPGSPSSRPSTTWESSRCLFGLNGDRKRQKSQRSKVISDFHTCHCSQTWANDHLPMTTTSLQRPPFWCPNFSFYNIKLPLNNDHLSTMVTNLGSRGWSLYTGLTVLIIWNSYSYSRISIINNLKNEFLDVGDHTSGGAHDDEDGLRRHPPLRRRVLALHGAGVHVAAVQC